MKVSKKRVVLIIFIISLLLTTTNIYKIYIKVIEPYNAKKEVYKKLKNENENKKTLIKNEKIKLENNDKKIEEIEEQKEKLEKVIYQKQIKMNKKIIYLTFDDGPSEYTNDILNILDKYDVKATFFVICSNNLGEYARKYIEKGHTIGLHSCSHKYSSIYSSSEAYFNDLNYLSNIIENETGYKSKFVRFPGGASNTVSRFNRGIMTRLSNELTNNGYKYYDWNIDSNDAGGASKEQVYTNVIGALENNNRSVAMVLMHDTKVATKDSLEAIIKSALDMGYTFSNINDYTSEVHHYINN